MKTNSLRLLALVLSAALIPMLMHAQQITTNWVAYNDHRAGPIIPPHRPTAASWGTASNVTTLDMGAPADTTGNLINFYTGEQLPVTVTFTRNNAPDDFGTIVTPGTNTPAGRLFFGVVDLSNVGIVGVDSVDNDFVTLTIANLDPNKRYVFRGTAARGGGYAPRWAVVTITNVNDWLDAHIEGSGPGVITSNDFPQNLGPGQAAYNSGHNLEGSVIGWDFIKPADDGTITIIQQQYVGPTPNQGTATSDNYGYAFSAMLLAEVETAAPAITTNPPPATTVEQNRSFTLSVSASGTPLFYQWYKQGVGALPGAISSRYTDSQAVLTDSGSYYVVVYNPLASVTSSVAQVTVNPDTTPPGVLSAFAYPVFDPATLAVTLNQVTVEFNEAIQPASASNPTQYTLSGGGGNPTSVVVTNNQSVVLTFASPLAEDTAYTISVTGVQDLVGNTAAAATTPFRTWVRSLGNALLFELYDTGPGVDITLLTNHASFPNNPIFRTNLWAFESRVALPDDSVGNFGTRTRGVFIPPVSGDWVFFTRIFDRGEVSFNPNGLDAAGKQLILSELTGNNPRDWDKFTSAPFRLQGGQGYYIEALQKSDAGGGTDAIKVAARLLGTGFPTIGVPITELDTNALAGPPIGFPLAPRDLGGPLTILQQPTNTTAEVNHPAVFSINVSNPNNLPVFYQWFRDGVEIPGATGPTYSFFAATADNNAMFSVRAAKIGSLTNSQTARLTVVPDTTRPRALSASTTSNLNEIIVRFDELIDTNLAQEVFSYSLVDDPSPVPQSAVMLPDGISVLLTFANPLVQGNSYRLDVSGIRDLVGLAINPDPTRLTFTAGGSTGAPQLAIARSGNNVEISWPAPSSGFFLEETADLGNPNAWVTVTTAPVVVGGRNTVTLTAATGVRIFRLRQ